MKYDFDKVYDRSNTGSTKWDAVETIFGSKDVVPMWVADMDFPVAKPIADALRDRAGHDFYGYTRPGESLVEAVVNRMKRKFDWTIQPEWVVFTPGVIPALHTAVRALTSPGDEVILQEPVYFPFFPAVTAAGCRIINNQLRLTDGRYEIDFEDLENKFRPGTDIRSSPGRIRTIILCNPHNPVGRLWDKEELTRMGEIVIGNGATVISDEIHCEILYKGYRHTPFASISKEFEQNSIICMAPSKTFNLAGLGTSSIIIPNEKLRNDFNNTKAGITSGQNIFGYVAMEAAYRHGDEWLGQMLEYLQGNLETTMKYFSEKIPGIRVIEPQGTYLLWLDCRQLGMDNDTLRNFMRESAKVGLNDGFTFGAGGEGFQRMNIACPSSVLIEALQRIEKAVNSL